MTLKELLGAALPYFNGAEIMCCCEDGSFMDEVYTALLDSPVVSYAMGSEDLPWPPDDAFTDELLDFRAERLAWDYADVTGCAPAFFVRIEGYSPDVAFSVWHNKDRTFKTGEDL